MGKYSHKGPNRISIVQTPNKSTSSKSYPVKADEEEEKVQHHTSIPITGKHDPADAVTTDAAATESSLPKSDANITEPEKTENIWRRIGEVTGIMKKNIDDATQRGEKLEDIEAKTVAIEEGAQQFRKSTAKVQKNLWWKSKKIMILIIGAVILLIVLIGLIIFIAERRLMNPFARLFSR